MYKSIGETLAFQRYSPIIATIFHKCKENAVSSRIGRYSIAFLYVMAL